MTQVALGLRQQEYIAAGIRHRVDLAPGEHLQATSGPVQGLDQCRDLGGLVNRRLKGAPVSCCHLPEAQGRQYG